MAAAAAALDWGGACFITSGCTCCCPPVHCRIFSCLSRPPWKTSHLKLLLLKKKKKMQLDFCLLASPPSPKPFVHLLLHLNSQLSWQSSRWFWCRKIAFCVRVCLQVNVNVEDEEKGVSVFGGGAVRAGWVWEMSVITAASRQTPENETALESLQSQSFYCPFLRRTVEDRESRERRNKNQAVTLELLNVSHLFVCVFNTRLIFFYFSVFSIFFRADCCRSAQLLVNVQAASHPPLNINKARRCCTWTFVLNQPETPSDDHYSLSSPPLSYAVQCNANLCRALLSTWWRSDEIHAGRECEINLQSVFLNICR